MPVGYKNPFKSRKKEIPIISDFMHGVSHRYYENQQKML